VTFEVKADISNNIVITGYWSLLEKKPLMLVTNTFRNHQSSTYTHLSGRFEWISKKAKVDLVPCGGAARSLRCVKFHFRSEDVVSRFRVVQHTTITDLAQAKLSDLFGNRGASCRPYDDRFHNLFFSCRSPLTSILSKLALHLVVLLHLNGYCYCYRCCHFEYTIQASSEAVNPSI
jgi:hypothetical protein